MARGKFIIIDGGEGSGKSTAVRHVLQKAQEDGYSIMGTREPGGSPYAEEIRRLILSDSAKHADAETMFSLFWAARRDHLVQTVRPALEAGVSVICDRFDSSTWAYQIVGQEQGQLRHLFYKMRQHYLASVEPDRYVILDVRPEVGLARAKGRGETLTHFDERDLDFHRRVSAGFLEFARALPPDQVTIIDANGLQTRELVLSVVAGLCWGPRRSRQKTAM